MKLPTVEGAVAFVGGLLRARQRPLPPEAALEDAVARVLLIEERPASDLRTLREEARAAAANDSDPFHRAVRAWAERRIEGYCACKRGWTRWRYQCAREGGAWEGDGSPSGLPNQGIREGDPGEAPGADEEVVDEGQNQDELGEDVDRDRVGANGADGGREGFHAPSSAETPGGVAPRGGRS